MDFFKPQVYLNELAGSLLRRFNSEPTSFDLAISTTVFLYHYADVVARAQGIEPYQAARDISSRVPGFRIIQALANAGKHGELTRHPDSGLIGLRADDFERGPGDALFVGPNFFERPTFFDHPETIVVETPDGARHDVLQTCNRVLKDLLTLHQ